MKPDNLPEMPLLQTTSSEKLFTLLVSLFASVEDYGEKILQALSIVGKYFDSDKASILKKQHFKLYPLYVWTNPKSEHLQSEKTDIEFEDIDFLFQILSEKGELIVNPNEKELDHISPLFKNSHASAAMLFPIQTAGTGYGYLIFETIDNQRYWKDSEVEQALLFSYTISAYLERINAARKIHESESKFKYVLNNSRDSVFIIDFNLRFIEVNRTAIKKFGYTKEELLEIKADRIVFNKYIDSLERYMTNLSKLEHVVYDYAVSKDGKIVPSEIVSKFINYDGTEAILFIVKDIAERQETERRILRAVIETEERERKRMARDLHDGLGPLLSTIKLYVNELQSKDIKKTEKQDIATYTNELIDDAIATTKTISNNLMPSVIRDYGVIPAIESFCKKVDVTEYLTVDFEHDIHSKRFESTVEIVIYRIVKELINNTIKYAKAKNIFIRIQEKGRLLQLFYRDDGIGFDVQHTMNNSRKDGMGLNNIITRAKSINGTCQIQSEKEQGMTVQIDIELN